MDTNGLFDEYNRQGTICFNADQLFSDEELKTIEKIIAAVPLEYVVLGDADEPNDVHVGRFMTDLPGRKPALVNEHLSQDLVGILGGTARMRFFQRLLGGAKHIRRVQVNIMDTDSFIGVHRDIDSNPDYEVAIVLQFGKAYGGGEFVTHNLESGVTTTKTPFRSMTVTRCDIPHEVKTVTDGQRISLVYFLAEHDAANARVA